MTLDRKAQGQTEPASSPQLPSVLTEKGSSSEVMAHRHPPQETKGPGPMTPACPPNAGAFCKVPESQQQRGLGLGQHPTCPGRGGWGERRGKGGRGGAVGQQWGDRPRV